MSVDNSSIYFWTSDIENLIEEKLKKEASYDLYPKNWTQKRKSQGQSFDLGLD